MMEEVSKDNYSRLVFLGAVERIVAARALVDARLVAARQRALVGRSVRSAVARHRELGGREVRLLVHVLRGILHLVGAVGERGRVGRRSDEQTLRPASVGSKTRSARCINLNGIGGSP